MVRGLLRDVGLVPWYEGCCVMWGWCRGAGVVRDVGEVGKGGLNQ
ncbi:hypothetical protein [Bartonella sp. B1098]|nr:hypothetical protein [Bartonella sp. B1098]